MNLRSLWTLNRIERYLGRTVVAYTLGVLAVLLVVLGFVELSIQLGKLNASYTLEKGLLYTLLKLPVYGYEVFPVALLIGALMGLGAMANRSELIVIRAAGWPVWRIFAGVLKSVLLFALVMVVLGEWVAPPSEALAKKLRAEALHKDFSIGSDNGVWLRQMLDGRPTMVHVRTVINAQLLAGVTLYEMDGHRLARYTTAPRAHWDGQAQAWRLEQAATRLIRLQNRLVDGALQPAFAVVSKKVGDPLVKLALAPEALTVLQVDTRYMGIRDLLGYIDFLRVNRLDARPYQLALARKLTLPLTLLAMLAIVFPLVFGSIRQVSMGQRIFIGVLIGLGFHFANQLLGNLALVYGLPVWLGATVPSVVLLVLALWGFARLDGRLSSRHKKAA